MNPLDFQSRPATCAAERLLAQRASKSLRDRPSEIEDFGWSPPGADFFGVGACPPEKKSLPCRFRARKSAGFQRNLRKGGAEGNPSPPPPGELERAAALSNFNLRPAKPGFRAGRRCGGGALLQCQEDKKKGRKKERSGVKRRAWSSKHKSGKGIGKRQTKRSARKRFTKRRNYAIL